MTQHILVVDDEEVIRDMVSRFLKKRGYRVSAVADAQAAWHVAETAELHLAILDIDLADENGLELLRAFKTKYPGLPVIMLTGLGYQEDLWQSARASGADAYTSKVLPIDQLLMDIHRVLGHRKAA